MKLLDLRHLKQMARETPSLSQPLRQLLIEEPDYIEAQEFLIKLKIWLRLMSIAEERR
ncbi:MAG: hypothetical protein HY515_02445 [Candidatus Aenigmarchaeota archaeon]|nr:hypothetical protein [Candidatus Aenigmarchaeota archaeon]